MSTKCRPATDRTPIRILGPGPDGQSWLASRDGEPLFQGVHDLGDAIDASSTRGDVPILVSEAVYAQMQGRGDAWYPVPSRVRIG